jgi:assimilatory nitrate reductase catalytic subunit
VQWPQRAGEEAPETRFFAQGGFFTPDRKGRFVATPLPAQAPRDGLTLNTGRVRDQWHTMTRTGASPRLARHLPEPFVEINPDDAKTAGVIDKGFARVATERGVCILRAVVTDRQASGHIFAPIHWTDETSAQARVGALALPIVDPVSGQPESKATPASVAPCAFAREGFLLARQPLAMPENVWWTRIAVTGGVAYRIASDVGPDPWLDLLRRNASRGDFVEFTDEARGLLRAASFSGDRAELVLFLGCAVASWDAALEFLSLDRLDAAQRLALLSGRSGQVGADDSPVVCACFGVSAKTIETAIASGCRDASAIGRASRAGTNCGSCLPEIGRMLQMAAPPPDAK